MDRFTNLEIYINVPQEDQILIGPFEVKNQEEQEFQVGIQDSYYEGVTDSAPSYNPLFYMASHVNVVGTGTPAHPENGLDYGAILEYSDDLIMDINVQIDSSVVLITGIPLMQRQIHHHGSSYQCNRLQGHFDVETSSCTFYEQLAKVCVKVNLNEESGNWELNSTTSEGIEE